MLSKTLLQCLREVREEIHLLFLTEIEINGNKTLVSLNINKEQEVDINFITSVYGKNSNSVVDWIRKDKIAYANQEKTLDYLRTAVPITTAKR